MMKFEVYLIGWQFSSFQGYAIIPPISLTNNRKFYSMFKNILFSYSMF